MIFNPRQQHFIDKEKHELHNAGINFVLENLEGSRLLDFGMIGYHGKCYKVMAHRCGGLNKMVVDYMALPSFHNVIVANPQGDGVHRLCVVSVDNIKELVDGELASGGSQYVHLSKMKVNITENSGLCVSIDLDWLRMLGYATFYATRGGFDTRKPAPKKSKEVPDFLDGMSKEQIVTQYEPLINKIVGQLHKTVCCDWDTLKSMAYEGFANAMCDYDPSKSNMNFMQYAAYRCRQSILVSLTEESRTVKIPWEEQKKMKERGESTFTSRSIDSHRDEDGEIETQTTNKLPEGMVENPGYENGDVMEYLYTRLEEKFPKDYCELFYMTYGLKGYNEYSNQDIAHHFGVSDGLISQKRKKMIEFIRHDTDLCEMLGSLTQH